MKKELWLKFENESEYTKKEGQILDILRGREGDARAVLFNATTKSVKRLVEVNKVPHDSDFIHELEALLGEGNVKYIEKEGVGLGQHYEPGIKQLIPCNCNMFAIFDNEKLGEKVLAFALCDDGAVYPLLFDGELGIGIISDCKHVSRYELH